jgi:hypothetical protein
MAHYAKIENGIVTAVIVAEQDFINSLEDANSYVQTSYNTREGVHELGGTPLRKNFAGIGFTYDTGRDAFIPPKPHDSWILNENTCLWNSPIPHPEDGKHYRWDEETQTWDLIGEYEINTN